MLSLLRLGARTPRPRPGFLAFAIAAILGFAPSRGLWADEPAADPLQDWAVQEGYSLRIAARGFSYPTSIAVVPHPSSDPKAPRMFVTELRGTIKAVANDWSLSDFAKIETFKPEVEWPDDRGEAGMAGVCLAPDQGQVFVTYAYRDKMGILRNAVSRFSAKPGTFEGAASGREDYLDLFRSDASAFSHQIGNCFVKGDSVFVSVGDGGDPAASRSLEKSLGKMLRMTLDGKPYPANPFAAQGGKAAYVYAYGLRNTFGLAVVGDRVFAAENGVDLDRFLEVRSGTDYGWDGSDGSIAANAIAVFTPTICPVQVAYAPPDQDVLAPKPDARFLIAVSDANAGENRPGVFMLDYDMSKNMVLGSPGFLVKLESKQPGQAVVGLALAPDGLYFTPIMPVGSSGVLMATRYDPSHAHPKIIGRGAGPAALITTYGCLKCHSLNGRGGTQGPALDRNSLVTRVQSRVLHPDYAKVIAQLDAIPDKTVQEGAPARKEVIAATDPDERIRLWVLNRLLYPKFDAPNAQMPSLKLTREQAESITAYLIGRAPKGSRYIALAKDVLSSRRFLAGIVLGLVLGGGFAAVVTARSRKRAA